MGEKVVLNSLQLLFYFPICPIIDDVILDISKFFLITNDSVVIISLPFNIDFFSFARFSRQCGLRVRRFRGRFDCDGHHHEWLAAAVADAQLADGRLVGRRVEHGVYGKYGRRSDRNALFATKTVHCRAADARDRREAVHFYRLGERPLLSARAACRNAKERPDTRRRRRV